jgi:hypothetical protein
MYHGRVIQKLFFVDPPVALRRGRGGANWSGFRRNLMVIASQTAGRQLAPSVRVALEYQIDGFAENI